MKSCILAIYFLFITFISGSRILVCVPTPSFSHQVVFHVLIKELLNKGHEVFYITTDPMYLKDKAPENLTQVNSHDISYELVKDILTSEYITGHKNSQLFHMKNIFKIINRSFEKQVLHPKFQDLIKRKVQFDLLIIEAFVRPALSLSHVFKAPVILMSSFGSHTHNYELMGMPTYPKLLYPYCMHQKVNNMTISDKIKVLWDVYHIEAMLTRIRVDENAMVKRLFGPDTPSLEDLGSKVDMLFLNLYPIWELNRPVPPGVIFIGGIYQNTPKGLPQHLKTYLDSSKKGVVYFSLGTNVRPSTFPTEKISTITNALAKLKYNVLVKWDTNSLPHQGNNTKVEKWLPQPDILRHPNIKAFITQGGLQSFDEALTGGVPLVGIPILADQWYNVETLERLKIGIGLLMEDLTEDKLINAVYSVTDDPSYRRNVMSLREQLRDQPQSALQRAVWWSEHVIRHGGGRHLRAPAANLSWLLYLDVPLIAVLAAAAASAAAATITPLYLLARYVRTIRATSVKLKSL